MDVGPRSFEVPAALLKSAADPYRLTILAILAAGERGICVCDFTQVLPLNQPAVSHHLRILREAGLVTCVRSGTWVHYRLAADARERLVNALDSIFQRETRA